MALKQHFHGTLLYFDGINKWKLSGSWKCDFVTEWVAQAWLVQQPRGPVTIGELYGAFLVRRISPGTISSKYGEIETFLCVQLLCVYLPFLNSSPSHRRSLISVTLPVLEYFSVCLRTSFMPFLSVLPIESIQHLHAHSGDHNIWYVNNLKKNILFSYEPVDIHQAGSYFRKDVFYS